MLKAIPDTTPAATTAASICSFLLSLALMPSIRVAGGSDDAWTWSEASINSVISASGPGVGKAVRIAKALWSNAQPLA
jgi:hypothetical protein